MRRSADRILVSHAGNLPRPSYLDELIGQDRSRSRDAEYTTRLPRSVQEIVDRQIALGVDIVNDGEFAKAGSYGGYMMSWLNGHTDRFKAMVCHAGVYNWHSMMASDIVRGRERPLGALPGGDLTKIDRQSPQRYADKFKTPTLVMPSPPMLTP